MVIIVKMTDCEKCGTALASDLGASLFPRNTRVVGPIVSTYFLSFVLQGARETFENYYRKQRRKQARLVLQPPSNMVG